MANCRSTLWPFIEDIFNPNSRQIHVASVNVGKRCDRLITDLALLLTG